MSSQPLAEPARSPDWTATLSDQTRLAWCPLLIRGAGPCALAAVRGRAGLGVCAVSTGSLTAGDGGTEPLAAAACPCPAPDAHLEEGPGR